MYFVKDNLIFDLDGTLIDSFKEIQESLFKAYLRSGIDINISNIKKNYIGPSIEKIILKITKEIHLYEIDRVKKYFREIYDNSDLQKTEIYPFVFETLKYFQANGKRLFVVTNKPVKPTKMIIREFFPNLFEDVVSPDIKNGKRMTKNEMLNFIFKKWNLTKNSSILVGDSKSDIEVAKNCGINSIGVLYGYGKKKDIIESKPEFFINNFKTLLEMIK